MKKKIDFDASQITTKLINRWLEKTRGLPVTLQLTKLSFAVVDALVEAYELGRQHGPGDSATSDIEEPGNNDPLGDIPF